MESRGDGDRRGTNETEWGGEKAPRPGPSPVGPPRQRLCSPDRRSARPSGHARASLPLREPFPAGACLRGAPSSWPRRHPRPALSAQRSGRLLFRRRARGLRAVNMEAVKTFNSEVGIAVQPPLPRTLPRPGRGPREQGGRGPGGFSREGREAA